MIVASTLKEVMTYGSFTYLLICVANIQITAKKKEEIQKVKAQLNMKSEMKELWASKNILGIEILREMNAGKLNLSQKGYLEKALKKFNMQNAKSISTLLVSLFKLSFALYSQFDEEFYYISWVSYSSAVGSLRYVMVC